MSAWLKRHFPVLFKEKMPVWLTIVASLCAALATYIFVPMYTHDVQLEDTRSAHLKQTTDELNESIIDLSQKVRRFDTAIAIHDKSATALHEDCLDLITKLQWRLVDLRVVLTDPNQEKSVTELSNSLENLRVKLNAPVSPTYLPGIRDGMKRLGNATRNVLNLLYQKASLQG
jgi:hypothetical protein